MDDLTAGVLEVLFPALAAFLQKVVKLLRLSLDSKLAAALRLLDLLPELELELESSSCEPLVLWNGMGEGIGVGIGEGNSLMGDKHLLKLKPGTSKVMVGAAQEGTDSSPFLGLRGSRTSTMI